MASLQRHRYADASAQFSALVSGFPTERELLDRARVYLDLCQRELKRQPSVPVTVEERLTTATAALNNADTARASELAQSVLSDAPQHDLALYLMAVVEARRGATESALGFLSRAVSASPEVRAQARHDADFEALRELEGFRQLLHAPAGSGASGSRRPRRGRSER